MMKAKLRNYFETWNCYYRESRRHAFSFVRPFIRKGVCESGTILAIPVSNRTCPSERTNERTKKTMNSKERMNERMKEFGMIFQDRNCCVKTYDDTISSVHSFVQFIYISGRTDGVVADIGRKNIKKILPLPYTFTRLDERMNGREMCVSTAFFC